MSYTQSENLKEYEKLKANNIPSELEESKSDLDCYRPQKKKKNNRLNINIRFKYKFFSN